MFACLFKILAMIEEAAGTRMYECKKISAQKTIEKKEAKLKEIQTVRLLTIYSQRSATFVMLSCNVGILY